MPTVTRPSADQLFRALGDRTRLRILCLLQRGELCVCDLVAALEVPQPTASRHLAYLKRSGLVHVRKDGAWCHYRLAAPGTAVQEALLKCLGAIAVELPETKRDRKRLDKATGCCG